MTGWAPGAGDSGWTPDPAGQLPPLTPDVRVRAVWSIGDLVLGGVLVLALLVLLEFVLGVPAALAFGTDSPGALGVQGFSVMLWDAGMVYIVYRLVKRKGGGWRDLGFVRPNTHEFGLARSWWSTPLMVGTTAVVGWLAAYSIVLVYGIMVKVFGLDFLMPSQQVPQGFYDHAWLLVIIGFSIVVTAPFAEETFFRAFLFGGLRRRLSLFVAALISGLCFSLAHLDPGLIIPFMGVGMVLAFTYERTGSIFSSMSVHFLFNLISFTVLVFVPEARK